MQRYEYYNANIEPRSDGRIVFYADAEEQIAALKDSLKSSEQIRAAEKEILVKEISLNADLRLENERLREESEKIRTSFEQTFNTYI